MMIWVNDRTWRRERERETRTAVCYLCYCGALLCVYVSHTWGAPRKAALFTWLLRDCSRDLLELAVVEVAICAPFTVLMEVTLLVAVLVAVTHANFYSCSALASSVSHFLSLSLHQTVGFCCSRLCATLISAFAFVTALHSLLLCIRLCLVFCYTRVSWYPRVTSKYYFIVIDIVSVPTTDILSLVGSFNKVSAILTGTRLSHVRSVRDNSTWIIP